MLTRIVACDVGQSGVEMQQCTGFGALGRMGS